MLPASFKDFEVLPSSDTNSNARTTAETVPKTVMAEQVSHNVVDNPESTGGSPLVDVAAIQAPFVSAGYGTTTDQAIPETKTDDVHSDPQFTNDHASEINAITSAAEPSAGDAAGTIDDTPSIISEPNASSADQGYLVNGINDALSAGEGDDSADVSLNSDTEGSRGDVQEQQKDEKHHARTNSVKKPTTFSKVSVTKNFLAKSATAAPAVVKTGEKPSPAGTPPQASLVAKPRLIAKTGTSLRDVQKARLSADVPSGPDASKVWNKNRRTYLQVDVLWARALTCTSCGASTSEAIHRRRAQAAIRHPPRHPPPDRREWQRVEMGGHRR